MGASTGRCENSGVKDQPLGLGETRREEASPRQVMLTHICKDQRAWARQVQQGGHSSQANGLPEEQAGGPCKAGGPGNKEQDRCGWRARGQDN